MKKGNKIMKFYHKGSKVPVCIIWNDSPVEKNHVLSSLWPESFFRIKKVYKMNWFRRLLLSLDFDITVGKAYQE